MLSVDRLKDSLFALVRAAIPRWAYAAPRFARVVKSRTVGDDTFLDVVPEDTDFPSMANVPVFHGLPGVSLTLTSGTRVLVEFSEGDPAKAFVRSWAGGEVVASLAIGGAGAVAAALAPAIQTYFGAIASHSHPGDNTPSASLADPPTVAATVVKVK